jgi:hypothetical protein
VYKKKLNFTIVPFIPLICNLPVILSPGNQAPALIASVFLCFIAFLAFTPPVTYIETEKKVTAVPTMKTGDDNADELLKQARDYKRQLDRLNAALFKTPLKTYVTDMIKHFDGIVNQVAENPSKARNLRQFMNYYLPTTVKVLTNYEDFYSRKGAGENIDNTISKIERSAPKIALQFKRQYDEMFIENALDISAEIEVLNQMINDEDGMNADDEKNDGNNLVF